MALTDIVNRIEQDAQKQAQEIIAQAEAQAKLQITEYKKSLQQKAQQALEKRQEQLRTYAVQQTQILNFTSAQKLLAAKREALGQLAAMLKTEVLAEPKLREQAYAYALQRVPKDIERITVAQTDRALVSQLAVDFGLKAAVEGVNVDLGTCLAYQGKAVLDCSIPLIMTEIIQMHEGKLAKELFGD